ncbi:helix-turn-helix transcriptional regulator [Spirosoma validum]|uniref:Response regulator transcription factor n=1 Tax=Spirosoma validum TaxID=2771355 RepID=A0A927B4Q5_9BACT|nr:LuxR C-terminal-related transcriptional regulator [Spirosoma validum]MBD2755601.1 response regulator transcription factor [Spirosoma validum]
MRVFYRVRFLFFFLVLTSTTGVYSQADSFQQLEQKVYQLNNALKYNESQALLLPVLQSKTFSTDDKYQAAILLSYTYKRVFDYQSTLKFLETARTFANESPRKDQYIASIRSEEAFVYFDTHEYKKASRLMALLEKSGFKHISLENQSKLVMQQGYLLFLNKQYKQAEATYNKAISWMRASAPCHLPMIFVKKMQLYNAMNRLDLLTDALKKSTTYADSCHIIKYDLYAYEELLHIYEGRNDLTQIALIKKKLDTLNEIYAREERIASLHNQKETILLAGKDRELHDEQASKSYLTVVLVAVFLIALTLLGWLLAYRRQQRRMEAESRRIKSELEAYLAQTKTTLSGRTTLEKEYSAELSERQREVLECMAAGMSNKLIADKLFISENTVKYHIKNIYLLLEVKDRKEFLVNVKK